MFIQVVYFLSLFSFTISALKNVAQDILDLIILAEKMPQYKQSGNPETYVRLHQREYESFFEKEEMDQMNAIIENNLYLGTQQAAGYLMPYQRSDVNLRAAALEKLRMCKITHIVCVCGEGEEWQPYRNDGIKYLNCKLNDGDEAMIEESCDEFMHMLNLVVPFIDEASEGGGAALVHCASGAHRSASIVCGYLMIKQNAKLDDVFSLVFHKRPIAFPVYWKYLCDTLEPTLFAIEIK
jgi:hypothetical protein